MKPLLAYLDNAATTRVDPKVAETVQHSLTQDYGNPASVHQFGITAERNIKTAETALQTALGDPDGDLGGIYWTSGGTESDALAILGAATSPKRNTIVYSAIEHSAVRGAAETLRTRGWNAVSVPVTCDGDIDIDRFVAAVNTQTSVVAVMLVNNEIGTILPVATLTSAIRALYPNVHVHCDAVQALGKIPIDIGALGVDSCAFSGHKVHGPKGVGALWLRKHAKLRPLWAGGGQQHGLRSGTLNVPGITGMGAAVQFAGQRMATNLVKWKRFGDLLVSAAQTCGTPFLHNGQKAPRSPHIISLAFRDIPAEPLLHALESHGVMASAGSACAEKTRRASPVLAAIGLNPAYGTIRFSFASDTTEAQVNHAAEALVLSIASLR